MQDSNIARINIARRMNHGALELRAVLNRAFPSGTELFCSEFELLGIPDPGHDRAARSPVCERCTGQTSREGE